MKLVKILTPDEWLFERDGTYFRLTRDDVAWLTAVTGNGKGINWIEIRARDGTLLHGAYNLQGISTP